MATTQSTSAPAVGIGTTLDYGLPFELMCRMVADAGFRTITIGGGDIVHSGYDADAGRRRIIDSTTRNGLAIDSVHAPFGTAADISVPDAKLESPADVAPTAVCERATPPLIDPGVTASPSSVLSERRAGRPTAGQVRPAMPTTCQPSRQRFEAVARMKMAIDAARALDTRIVVIHPTDRFSVDETKARIGAAKDSLRELSRYAAARNIRLAVENLASPLSMQVFEAVLEYLPDLGICYDTSHALISRDLFGVVGRYCERIIAVHLSDNRGKSDDHLLPFEGIMPWEEFAYYLSRMKNLSCFMLEVEIRESAFKDRGEFLAEAYRRARQVLELSPRT
jgi:sugar phosphate isomerase/epimerase